ncbi:MAG: T9SS type A sorting domain-containing protein [Saprospirales bacterium]|nr:T9SS type A sorting domain-containing protein [Saprospirales bacterium]
MYPFLLVVGCCVGDFQNDFGNGDCLGDAWIRATGPSGEPTGGIGGLFSSILQSWSPPMEGQDEMNLLLVDAAAYHIRHTIGGIAVHGFGSMIEDYGAGGEEMADTWNIFGDPSVVLWTDTPDEMVVDHVPVVNVGTAQMQVFCDVEDALVGLYYQGDVLGSGLVSGGVAIIDFDPVLVPEQILVTVTAFNYLPYQGPVEVIVTQGPFVLLASQAIDDSPGNNNQKADFSENILMNVTLENVGTEVAPNVVATLSTDAPQITITQNQMIFGDIQETAQITENGAFAFTVADLIADQEIVFFELTLNSDGNNWTYTLPVKLHAPVIKAQPIYTLSDDQFGNGNGRMDQGELFKMYIPVKNTGHSLSPNAIGTLSTNSPFVTVLSPTFDMGAIVESGGTGIAEFNLIVAPEVPIGEQVEFQFSVAAGPYGDDMLYEGAINLVVEDFETGLDENFGWEQLTTSEWFLTDWTPYEGDTCMQSGAIPDNAKTQVSMNVEVLEPSHIRFARRVSCEGDWDYLRFFINGVKVGEWTGELGWGEVDFFVNQAGPTEFKWSYEKDTYVANGEDAAWIDEIILPLIAMPEDTTTTGVADLETGSQFSVFPNPAHSAAQATFSLPQAAQVSLVLYNAHGQQVVSVYEGELSAGAYAKGFSVASLPAGVYWLTLRAGEEVRTLKVVR